MIETFIYVWSNVGLPHLQISAVRLLTGFSVVKTNDGLETGEAPPSRGPSTSLFPSGGKV